MDQKTITITVTRDQGKFRFRATGQELIYSFFTDSKNYKDALNLEMIRIQSYLEDCLS